ncbi:phospholipase A and acyltransferase 3-like [Pristis pectinata]|uniref:phospholipase A and acyltransferase 3-like n=1 Tax=Pristis pectinata TaxID=685728 RepID=UPI00223E1BAC|nr:phospholipase A and acyltransferase 3-like [Pristis pectinata]XP_051901000.1 phospholipase A and acyltransferase 3-like [Pristis pectinata]
MASAFDYVEPKVGDLIEIFRLGYQHWALYVGNGYVIHLAPPSEVCDAGASSIMSVFAEKAYVKKESLHRVAGANRYQVNNKLDRKYRPRPAHIIVKEAEGQLGQEMDYSLFSANCEHFVTDLRYGVSKSCQVDDVVTGVGVGIGVSVLGLTAMLCYQLMKPQQRHKK